MTEEIHSQRRARLPAGLLLPSLAALVVTAILVSLGNWQVARLAYKTELQAHVTARLNDAPQPLPPASLLATLDPEATDYTPVRLTGTFRHDREFHVFTTLGEPRGRLGGVGWWIFTPFVETDGTTVIVNRGFVPDASKNPETRSLGQTPAETTITGLLRRPEGSNTFTPANDPVRNRWFTRDPIAMAKNLSVPSGEILPYYVDASAAATPASGLPQAGETVVTFANNHLGYAITWYGLALACVGVYAVYIRRRMRAQA